MIAGGSLKKEINIKNILLAELGIQKASKKTKRYAKTEQH